MADRKKMATREIIEIACNIDEQYLKYCYVMLTSLFENNKDASIRIHLIASELSQESQNMLKELVEEKYRHKIVFYSVGDEMLKQCSIYGDGSHITIATYYRICLESILPADIHKVLYIDCDLIVEGSIKGLWDTDISGVAVGCVEDMWSGKDDNYTRLDYDSKYSYFNAGVLLINLDYWRKIGFQHAALEYAAKHQGELIFNDQDVLNALLHDKKIFLPFRYNLQDGFFRCKRRIRKDAEPDLDKEMESPVIIHYTGGKKPWHYKSQHPYKQLFFKYLDLTPWAGERPISPASYKIKLLIDKFLTIVYLKPRKYRKLKI